MRPDLIQKSGMERGDPLWDEIRILLQRNLSQRIYDGRRIKKVRTSGGACFARQAHP